MILNEGGNVFKNDQGPLTDRIPTKAVPATIAFLEKITGLDFTAEKSDDGKPVKWLGTTGRKEDPDGTFELNSSGDLDLSVDANEHSKEEVIAKLKAFLKSKGVPEQEWMNLAKGANKKLYGIDAIKHDGYIKDAGDQVHFRTPIAGNGDNGYVQTDFMFSTNPKFQQGSMIGGDKKYRGEHRQILIASIAKARGMKYSPKFGLVDRETNEPVQNGDDWTFIAKTLLGQTASVQDIRSVDGIINYLIKLPNYEDLVKDARETLGRQGVELPVKESTLEDIQLQRIKQIVGRLV